MKQAQVIQMHQNTQVINYNITDAAISELKEKNNKLLMEWDGKDFESIRAAKREVLKFRTGVEPLRKEYNAAALEHQRKVNAEAKRITEALEKIEEPLDVIIEAENARVKAEKEAKIKADQDRVNAIVAKISEIARMPIDYAGKTATVIQHGVDTAKLFIEIDPFNYEELALEASTTKRDTLAKLQDMHSTQLGIEARQAEVEAAAIAQKLAQEEENKRLAEERQKLAAQQEEIRIANEAKEAALAEERRIFEAEKEQLRLAKEVEEKQRFEEARLAEREKQLVEAKVVATNVPEEIITTNHSEPAISASRIDVDSASNPEEKVNTPLTPYGILLAFVEEIILCGGKYKYLNGTQIVGDAYKILRQVKGE